MTSKGAKNSMSDNPKSPARPRRRLRRGGLALLISACALLGVGISAAPALAMEYGFSEFDVTYTNADGTPATQAGSHPFAVTTHAEVTREGEVVSGHIKDLIIEQVAGFTGDTTSIPRCSNAAFLSATTIDQGCPIQTQVGVTVAHLGEEAFGFQNAVYNLVPPPGVVSKFGFLVFGVFVTVNVGVKESPEHNVEAALVNVPQTQKLFGSLFQLWGVPADPAHNNLRGECAQNFVFVFDEFSPAPGECPANSPERAFLTLPRSCVGPAATAYRTSDWENPDVFAEGSVLSHDDSEPPVPQGFTGCESLGFNPTITSQPTTKAAASPTGLDFSLDVKDEGLTSTTGLAQSDIKKAVVTLPEGMSANPSIAEGLTTCTEADLDHETLNAEPGQGCPEASKIGTVSVVSPLVEEPVNGSLFIATPKENPFGSTLAMYIVIKNPKLGIIVKQPANVERDPKTGQLTTVVDNIPQLPFSHFKLHFREGARSPLASPPACGTYDVKAVLTPWSGTEPITTHSAFQIISGSNNGACPSGGTPPFHPLLEAGTLNNAAGGYSPFNVRLSRNDGEQEFTHFSIKLPPGLVGKLAGIPFCSEVGIAQARSRDHDGGGAEELASPSCPAASEVGSTLVGAGVGSSLTYAPGKVYLAGPYNGSSLSIAAITAAKIGPFDLGTVVVRDALKIDPETAEVFIDATGSDPIPHIIDGFMVHARDIRVYVDRPEFVLNPTSCARTSTASTVLGSGLDFASDSDDQPITVTSPFQAASCASLGFAPKLDLSLKGSTKRGGTPKFRAVLTARKGDANIGEAQVTLPHSEFLEQAHIKTICTRVQFKEGTVPGEKCPAASIYGYAKAITPLLDEPLQGPVYLRSSSHPLPDLVAALNSGKINIALAGHIDSVKGGRIRNTFEAVPDAPVTKFTLEMQGGKKGLLVNSTNLCKGTNKAISHFIGQNGKVYDTNPILKAPCKKAKKKSKRPARSKG
jgi:hypothetical protein